MGETSSTHVGRRKPAGKRQLGRHKRRWDNDIRMNLKETG